MDNLFGFRRFLFADRTDPILREVFGTGGQAADFADRAALPAHPDLAVVTSLTGPSLDARGSAFLPVNHKHGVAVPAGNFGKLAVDGAKVHGSGLLSCAAHERRDAVSKRNERTAAPAIEAVICARHKPQIAPSVVEWISVNVIRLKSGYQSRIAKDKLMEWNRLPIMVGDNIKAVYAYTGCPPPKLLHAGKIAPVDGGDEIYAKVLLAKPVGNLNHHNRSANSVGVQHGGLLRFANQFFPATDRKLHEAPKGHRQNAHHRRIAINRFVRGGSPRFVGYLDRSRLGRIYYWCAAHQLPILRSLVTGSQEEK